MRRAGGKLSSLNWKLVLLAGIFQILTLIFDQIVIQYEEKNREMTFNLLTESEQRSAYLSMNSRVGHFLSAFENIIFFTTSSNFSNDKKKYLFYSSVLDQARLIEDIFRDGSIKKAFLNKTIEAENIKGTVEDLTLEEINIEGGPEIPMKIFKYEDFFLHLVEFSLEIADLVEEDPDLKLNLDDSKIIIDAADLIQQQVEYNNYYLYYLLNDLVNLIRSSEKKIDKTNNEISSIQTNKQLMLLLGVVFQLLSLLCLLFLFRNILSENKLSK
jgi:hypothetical protein